MKYLLFAVLATLNLALNGAINQVDTLYINRGEIEAVDSTRFEYLAFNSSPVFHKTNTLIRLMTGDSLKLYVVNTDTLSHSFACQSQATGSTAIPPGSTAVFNFGFAQSGVFIYYDTDPNMAYLGLAGMISVENNSKAHFFWNIKEHNKKWNDTIARGYQVNWSDYYPNYFLINGNSNPHINADPVARVTGNVGDTIYIVIANTGRSVHSMHFHGYHANITYSSAFPHHQGRSKDTFPVLPMESLILRLVPDKPGEFPVHDHNLVAVSGGNYYPNGMFLTLLIQ